MPFQLFFAKVLQEEYHRQLNRINAEYNQRISVIDSDGFINEGIDTVFENLAIKFESNSLVRNHLRQLEIKKFTYKPKQIVKVDKDTSKVSYPKEFYLLTRQSLVACKENCSVERVLDLTMIQSSDLNSALKDPNWEPSYEWEQALVEENGASYIKNGKTISEDINLEVDSTYFWRKAVQVAVLNTKAALGDVQDYNAELNTILVLDRLFLENNR